MSNSFAEDLYKKAQERFSIDSVGLPMSDWIEKNTTLKKRPFSFKEYEFQKQIVDDLHPDMSVIKISQVGLTEVQIRKALGFLVRNRGTSLIFSLPNEDMYNRVSKGRVKPIVNEDKVFTTPEDVSNKSVRSTELMQFGQSFLYLVPAIESAATSISADFIMNDEIDLSDQKMISLFQSRLQASKHRISQKFSTPSFPLYGIDLNWQSSDQHNYLCRCEKCGHWNDPQFNMNFINLPGLPSSFDKLTDITIDFKDQLDFDNSYIKCEKCHFPLDLKTPGLRKWVASFPSRKDSRGYKISPFVTDNLDLRYIFKQLWDYQKNEYIRGFYNTVLGMPYSDGNIQIPTADILSCMTPSSAPLDLKDYENLWVGIDVGETCHIVIGEGANKERLNIVALYQVKADQLVQHCKELCEKYNVRGGAIDRFPYTPTANDVMKVSNGKILPVEYRGSKEVNIVENEYKDITHAQVNRTTFLDKLATRIRKQEMKISGYGQYKQVFIDHLRDMIRNETPEKQAEWVKLQGNDHFFHASAFMLLAPELQNVIRFNDSTDTRSMFASLSVGIKNNNNENIIGSSKKTLDNVFGYD